MKSKGQSSPSKKPKVEKPTSLLCLPEEIILGILSQVANNSLRDIASVELISKKIGILANHHFVRKNLLLSRVLLFPNYRTIDGKRFYKFMKRLRKSGNAEAIYRKGLISFFSRIRTADQRRKGLEEMKEAARNNNKEAIFCVGLVLLCLGGDKIDEGLRMLSSLLTGYSLSILRIKFERLRKKIEHAWSWWGKMKEKELKSSYFKRTYNCDGRTRIQNPGWCFYGSDRDLAVKEACSICVWDYELYKLTEHFN